MDDIRFGSVVRAVRVRLRLRQADVARMAGISPTTISRIEHGRLDEIALGTLRRVAAVLEIRVDLVPRWRGGELDRLMGARHSALHELVARDLAARPDWMSLPEVSFSHFGERGVIDRLIYHPVRRALGVIELKTDIVDVNEVVGTHDRKVRLAPEIARARGWDVPRGVTASAWLIVADSRTNRRRVQAHEAMLRSAYPLDGRSIASWLADPDRVIRCLSFWPDSHGRNVGRGITAVRRVVLPRPRSGRGPGAAS
jgi:transcriptional regulator with XRE-family HTH domain